MLALLRALAFHANGVDGTNDRPPGHRLLAEELVMGASGSAGC